MGIFCPGKNTYLSLVTCLLKKFMAPSIFKLENKVYKITLIAKYSNKKFNFINFSLPSKIWELLKA